MTQIITILFDEKSTLWEKDQYYNSILLKTQERFVNDFITLKGYIYLNQIYEMLGVKWDPDQENVCFKRTGKYLTHIEFETFYNSNGSILVHICHV